MELLLPKIAAPAPTLPSYVKLDMAFGVGAGATLYDKSRYRSHGAITTATWAAGVHGYCLDFVAANPDYVEIPAAHTQLNFTSEDFSIIARVYLDILAADVRLFIRGFANDDGYELYISGAGHIIARTFQNLVNQSSYSNAGMIVINTWYTIGMSRNGASGRVYRNGVDITTTAGVHIDPETCARVADIGIHPDHITNPLDGRIEFLRIFGGIALTASEHLAWHRALA